MTIFPNSVFDFRAPVDVEASPGHTWLRQIPLAEWDLSTTAVDSLRRRQSVVPALLLRGRTRVSVSAFLKSLVGNRKATALRLQDCGPQFGTYLDGSPNPFIVISPCRPVLMKLVDILAIRSRMYRPDWEGAFAAQYLVSGQLRPILRSDLGFPRVQLPHDHSAVRPTCPTSTRTWETMQTVFRVPGIVLSLAITPVDVVVIDNERCLFAIDSIDPALEEQLLGQAYPLSQVS